MRKEKGKEQHGNEGQSILPSRSNRVSLTFSSSSSHRLLFIFYIYVEVGTCAHAKEIFYRPRFSSIEPLINLSCSLSLIFFL